MAIHHAAVKRAASKGLALEETSKNLILRGDFGGKVGQSEFRFALDFSAKDAVAAGILAQEVSDRLAITQGTGRSSTFKVTNGKGIVVSGDDLQSAIEEALSRLDKLPAAAAAAKPAKPAKAKAADEGDEGDEDRDPTQDEIDAGTDIADAEEEAEAGSVVPAKYRKLYQERGDATHCGDDLAKALKDLLVNDSGTDEEALRKLAAANGIDFEKYTQNQTRGWLGRARMSVGNVMRGKQRRGKEIFLDISGVKPDGSK